MGGTRREEEEGRKGGEDEGAKGRGGVDGFGSRRGGSWRGRREAWAEAGEGEG
jgi:hypothetical protein